MVKQVYDGPEFDGLFMLLTERLPGVSRDNAVCEIDPPNYGVRMTVEFFGVRYAHGVCSRQVFKQITTRGLPEGAD